MGKYANDIIDKSIVERLLLHRIFEWIDICPTLYDWRQQTVRDKHNQVSKRNLLLDEWNEILLIETEEHFNIFLFQKENILSKSERSQANILRIPKTGN